MRELPYIRYSTLNLANFRFPNYNFHITSNKDTYVNCKVLSLLEGCLDLISSASLSMKIQIAGGNYTKNLGFKSPLRKVKFFFALFLFFSFSDSPYKTEHRHSLLYTVNVGTRKKTAESKNRVN